MVTSDVTAGQTTTSTTGTTTTTATTTTTTPTPTTTETFADYDDEQFEEKTAEPLECSIVSEQYEELSEKLGDLRLQLKQLQTAIDKINFSAPAENTSRSGSPQYSVRSVKKILWLNCILMMLYCLEYCQLNTSSSSVADKPRDTFAQYVLAWLTPVNTKGGAKF